jgi:hypothetical protein
LLKAPYEPGLYYGHGDVFFAMPLLCFEICPEKRDEGNLPPIDRCLFPFGHELRAERNFTIPCIKRGKRQKRDPHVHTLSNFKKLKCLYVCYETARCPRSTEADKRGSGAYSGNPKQKSRKGEKRCLIFFNKEK